MNVGHMEKEIISEKEGISISLFFLTGAILVIPASAAAGKDLWIAIIISTLLGILISLVYIKILSSFPGKNLFDISEILFGKAMGKAVSLLYVWFAFHITSLIFIDFFYFIKTVTFPEANPYLTVLFPAIICIWGVKLGIEGIGRFSNLTIIPVFILLALALCLMTPKMKFDHFLPVLENGFKPIYKGSFMTFSFPFADAVLFMGVFNCFKEKKSISKVYFTGIILAGITLLIVKVSSVAVLGSNNFAQYYYPLYATVSRIEIGDFIKRIEIIVGIMFVFGALVKAFVCMLVACKGLSSILSFDDYRFLVTPMVLLNVVFAFISNKSIIQLSTFDNLAYRYYAFPFHVIIPIIILIFTLIRGKKIIPQK